MSTNKDTQYLSIFERFDNIVREMLNAGYSCKTLIEFIDGVIKTSWAWRSMIIEFRHAISLLESMDEEFKKKVDYSK